MTKLNNQNASDHDLLIKLDTKVDNLALDIKELKDGLTVRMAAIELKVVGYDKIIAEADPTGTKKKVDELGAEIHDFKTTVGIYRVIAGVIGGFIFFLISQLPAWLRGIGFFK